MTIAAEILSALRAKTSLAKIKEKYQSKSQLYEAIRLCSDEADETVAEVQERLHEVSEQMAALEAKLEKTRIAEEESRVESERLR